MARRKQEEQKAKSAKTAGKSEGQWRPFHETIVEMLNRVGVVEMLNRVGGFGGEKFYLLETYLLELIKITAIPAGHDEIIAAIEEWEKKREVPPTPNRSQLLIEVKNSLREQKRLAEEKTVLKKQVEDLMDQLDIGRFKLSG